MKKAILAAVLGLATMGTALAWQPSGWSWFSWPYAYDLESGDWHWFNTGNTQWTVGPLPGGTWQKLGASPLAADWTYFSWPYAYDWEGARWYYMNEGDTQWCVNLRTGLWTLFGRVNTPPPAGDYLVIDLSAGPSASSYPVSSLSSVPPGGWPDEYKTTKLVMRRIPAGTFTMGSPTGELGRNSDETQHQVTLTQDFYIGVFEVTQKQWERVMGTWPSYFNIATHRDSRPVEQVSYNSIRGSSAGAGWPANGNVDADSFMGRLRSRTGRAFDLPTESQWEFAGRAGTTTALNSGYNLTSTGNDPRMSEVGRYWDNGGSGYTENGNTTVGTAKAGSYLPNVWGLYDIHGNVWEWCLDWYGTYPGTVSDPKGPASGSDRVFRGGSWTYDADVCRVANRFLNPVYAIGNGGFRAALPPGQ